MSIALVVLAIFLCPLVFVVGLALWTTFRKSPEYIRERMECRIHLAQDENSIFVLPVSLLDGSQRYIIFVEGNAGIMRERRLPARYTTIRRGDAPPVLKRLTTYRRSGKAENPDKDYFVRETFALVVPTNTSVTEPGATFSLDIRGKGHQW